MIRFALMGMLGLLAAACATPPAPVEGSGQSAPETQSVAAAPRRTPIDPSDPIVWIRILNTELEPLQCQMKFGHWVDRDLGTVEMGGDMFSGVVIQVQRQTKDGALYIMRDDGLRRMMVENIFCARKNAWQETVGQVDLDAVRRSRANLVWFSCAWPEAGGRVACKEPTFLNGID